MPTQELQQKITDAVASVDQNKPIFLNQRFAVNHINFQETLQREAFWHA